MKTPENTNSRSLEEGVRFFLLNETKLGPLYQRYFKRFKIVRSLVLLAWRLLLPVGLRLYYRVTKRKQMRVPLRRLADVATVVETVVAQQEVIISPLSIFPEKKS